MNKLVMLSEIRSNKIKNKNRFLKNNEINVFQEDNNKSYITFKEKFDNYDNEESIMNIKKEINHTKYEEKLNQIIERIFLLDNKTPLVDFINSIYDDDLGTNIKIKCIRKNGIINEKNEVKVLKNASYNIKILAEDDYRKFEYQIQFQTNDKNNIALTILKNDLSIDHVKVVNLNTKRREYKNNSEDNTKNTLSKSSKPWLIMLNSDIEVPDVYEFKFNNNDKNSSYEFNILKSWKYDLKRLFENNMYLLFPMKVLDLRKRLSSISEDILTNDFIKDEILRFFKEMNAHLRKLKDNDVITEKDINEFNLIAIDLLNDFIKEKNNICIDVKKDIEEKLKDIVV